MRTITNLIKPKIHVYVKFNNQALCRQFMQQAEWEGFTVGENGKPTDIKCTDIIAVQTGKKLCHLGWASRMAYHINPKNVMRVDYEKYINGCIRYIVNDRQVKDVFEYNEKLIRDSLLK